MPAKKTTTRKPVQSEPVKQLHALLPRITADELHEVIVVAYEEAAERCRGYATLTEIADPPVDAINEGIVIGTRFHDLAWSILGSSLSGTRATRAHHRINDSLDALKEWRP